MAANEAQRETVMRTIIEPMLATYEPPRSARDDLVRCKALLEMYIKSLEQYPPSALRKAWRDVFEAHHFWHWPTPGAFITACERYRPQLGG